MADIKLITLTDPRSAAAEAFRTLRTSLTLGNAGLHTLVVTSAAQADGKSLSIANLAVTFAQAGHKTILVDCDLRKPSQHTIWGIDNQRGINAMMAEDSALSTPPLVQTSIANLQLLPAGVLPPNPADTLGSTRMNEIIGVLKARAHYVLFDVPPVLAATDAALMGAKVDGTVLVVRAGYTRRDQLENAKQTLERVHVKLLGAVLTNAARDNLVASYQ
jgi:capsular exopolysaccharide synthesis family protein